MTVFTVGQTVLVNTGHLIREGSIVSTSEHCAHVTGPGFDTTVAMIDVYPLSDVSRLEEDINRQAAHLKMQVKHYKEKVCAGR